jgi:hypothetical protein
MNEFEKQVAAAFIDVGMFVALTTALLVLDTATCADVFGKGLARIKEQNFPPEVVDEVADRLAGILAEKAKRDEEVSK